VNKEKKKKQSGAVMMNCKSNKEEETCYESKKS
jgi:hypothetical protein